MQSGTILARGRVGHREIIEGGGDQAIVALGRPRADAIGAAGVSERGRGIALFAREHAERAQNFGDHRVRGAERGFPDRERLTMAGRGPCGIALCGSDGAQIVQAGADLRMVVAQHPAAAGEGCRVGIARRREIIEGRAGSPVIGERGQGFGVILAQATGQRGPGGSEQRARFGVSAGAEGGMPIGRHTGRVVLHDGDRRVFGALA